LVEALRPWLREKLSVISQKTKLAEAIRYALSRWAGLCLFLEDGRVEIDNNAVERAIRPLAMRRSLCPSSSSLWKHANNNIALDRSADRDGWAALLYGFWHFADVAERVMHTGDQRGQLICRQLIVPQVSGNDLGRPMTVLVHLILDGHYLLLVLIDSNQLHRSFLAINLRGCEIFARRERSRAMRIAGDRARGTRGVTCRPRRHDLEQELGPAPHGRRGSVRIRLPGYRRCQ
jgi:hypothetical protein